MIVEVYMYFVMRGGGKKKTLTDPSFSFGRGGITRVDWGIEILTLVVEEPFASWSLGGREGRMGKKESLPIDLGVVRP